MAIVNGQPADASDFVSTPSGPSDSGKVPMLDANGQIPGGFLPAVFGDGSDGDIVLDGSASFGMMSGPSSNVYVLTRELYANNLTINSGVTLKPDGYRIFVKNTINGAGIIDASGNPGGNGSGGTGGGGASAVGSGPFKSAPGKTGGNSATNFGTGGQSGTTGNIGNPGAKGGDSANNGGGSAGPVASKTAPHREKWAAFLFRDFDLTQRVPAGSGSGASGCRPFFSGGSGITGGGGGGSGSSGGIIWIAARIWAGTFTIQAPGGQGGNAGNSSGSNMVGGNGGGGGTGGISFFIYFKKTWTGTYSLAGGTGGAPGTGAAGTGNSGDNGNTGTYYEIDYGSLL